MVKAFTPAWFLEDMEADMTPGPECLTHHSFSWGDQGIVIRELTDMEHQAPALFQTTLAHIQRLRGRAGVHAVQTLSGNLLGSVTHQLRAC